MLIKRTLCLIRSFEIQRKKTLDRGLLKFPIDCYTKLKALNSVEQQKAVNKMKKLLLLSACVMGLTTAQMASALTLGIGLADPYQVGQVVNGIQAGGQVDRDVTMVNNLIPLALGGSTTIGDDTYTRSMNAFGSLPTAVAGGAVFGITPDGFSGFSGDSVNLTLSGSFTYLVVAYDGPNGGAAIYNISGLAAGTVLTLSRYAQPTTPGSPGVGPLIDGGDINQYQMTGFTFLNPGTSVPDGGTTAALLGISMVGLGFLRRRIGRSA
jgi:VPDSG-CTERM motif